GNHDLLDDYTEAQAALTEAPKSLYRGAYEGGNHSVLLENAESRPLWDLICLNTTTQGVQEAQENWLRQVVANDDRPKVGGAFCFLHIPLLEYAKVWDSGKAQGVKQEEVCTYGEDGSAFPILKKLGVRACFCGHDHVNDYTGRIGEVDMVYGRASGHAGYGGEQMRKGGKLITLDALKGSYRWQTVFADGSSWSP
ncbi:MAG: metallophosphoesterase, partial [Verrucomicrobiales bacterium]